MFLVFLYIIFGLSFLARQTFDSLHSLSDDYEWAVLVHTLSPRYDSYYKAFAKADRNVSLNMTIFNIDDAHSRPLIETLRKYILFFVRSMMTISIMMLLA